MSEKDKIKAILEEKDVPEKISPDSIREMLYNHAPKERKIVSVKRNLVRILSAAAAITFVVGIGTKLYSIQTKQPKSNSVIQSANSYSSSDDKDYTATNIRFAKSYKEVYDYMDINRKYYDDGIIYNEEEDLGVNEDAIDDIGETGFNDKISGEFGKKYTDTYNQEEGVIEADIVKTDGEKIFYKTNEAIIISDVENGEFKTHIAIEVDSDTIDQMYLYEDKLIVLSTQYEYMGESTLLTVYSKDTYEQIAQYRQDGWFHDVRLTDDGYLYLISNDYFTSDGTEVNEDETYKYIPLYGTNGSEECIPYDDIMISCENPNSDKSFINISSFDLNSNTPCNPIDIKAIVGSSGVIYCSDKNLYATYFNNFKTEITRFSIDSGKIIPQAGTSVDGYINDQFSMSEYDGYFRIATSIDNPVTEKSDEIDEDPIDDEFVKFDDSSIDDETGEAFVDTLADNRTNNALYVLDMDLNEVGMITDFGISEMIQSVNFNGNMAYIVTFRQTDPLYSIDLSNPKSPVIRDALKVTGYSSYMQKWNDKLFGFGESGDKDGNLNGLKLSMFDNSDPDNLKVIDSSEITFAEDNTYISSEGLCDRKALLISPEQNIIGIPVYSEKMDSDYHVYENESGYYFYSFENGKFIELGKVSLNIDDYYPIFNRAVIIDDYVYMLSNTEFISANTKEFEIIDKLELE